MIRGFAANSVLIVIDGVRMNNAIYRGGNLQNIIMLDPANLAQAEVVFGPSSVAYGSDALGGVMDFHTKTPEFSTDYLGIATDAFLRYSSANNAVSGNYQVEFNLPNVASFSSLSYSKFGDLRTGSQRTDRFPGYGKRLEYIERQGNTDVIVQNDQPNVQTPSGYDQYNFLQKLRWKIGSFSDFAYSYHYSSSSDIPRYDRLIERTNGQLRNAEWYYGPQLWQMHTLQSNFYYPNRFFNKMRMTTAFQFVEESRHDRRYQSDILRSRNEKVDALSLNLDFDKTFGFNGELYYGLELVTNEVTSTAKTTNIVTNEQDVLSTRYPDGGSDYNTMAAYLSVKDNFGEKLIVSSGLRYTYTVLNAEFVDKTFFDFPFDDLKLNNGALTGNIGLVFLANNNLKLNALISSGFRAPNIDDVAKVFDSEPGVVIVPNSDLKPEFSYNVEYGVSKTFQNGLSLNMVNYFSFLRDALVRRPFSFNGQSQIDYDGTLSDVYAEQNVGKAFIWGLSLNAHWKMMNGLVINASITYNDGEDSIENLPLRHVTPIFGELGMTMNTKKLTSTFTVKFSGGIAFEDLAPSEQNKIDLYSPDGALPWSTLNIFNSYKLTDYYSIHFNLENILDTHYRPYSSGISAPGFNAVISFRAGF